MAVGPGRRMVVELEPELKRRLHARLRSDGRDFKGWLLERIREYLGTAPQTETPAPELDERDRCVLDAISSDAPAPHHVDDIVDATGLDVREIGEALLRLQLLGCVEQHFGGYRRVLPS